MVPRALHIFCGSPDPGAKLVLLSGQTSAFAAGRASHNGAPCTAYFLWEARPRGEAYASERADLSIRRGSRLPQWRRVHCIFLWEPRPRAKLVLLSGLTSAFAAGRGSHNGAACTAYFLWEARPWGGAYALSGQTSPFAAGRASHNGAACTAYFCGRPDLGAKLFLGPSRHVCRGARLPQWAAVSLNGPQDTH